MRWSLWLALIGLLVIPGHHHLTQRWDLTLVTVLAAILLGVGYDARHQARARFLYRCAAEGAPRAVHTAIRTEPLALDHDEQQQFRAIEERLASEDPEFAERFHTLNHPDHPAVGGLDVVIGLGLVTATLGILSDPALIVVGVLIGGPAVIIRMLLSSPRQPRPMTGLDDGASSGPDRGAPV